MHVEGGPCRAAGVQLTRVLCASQFASAKERVVQILPVYFWFAQLVCFWFTLTAISLFLPYER